MKAVRFTVLPFAMLIVQMSWATHALYQCADGTFTNRVERQCAPYESKGIARVQGGSAEASKQPFAEVKPVKGQDRGR
ncbi:hypothetical protein [Nitrospira sp. Nam74]